MMLRTNSQTRPTPHFLRACLVMFVAVTFPGLAQALSTTFNFADADTGASVDAVWDDSITPGEINLQIDITSAPTLGANLTRLFIIEDDDNAPAISVSGGSSSNYFGNPGPDPCRCLSITKYGSGGLFDATGVTSATNSVTQGLSGTDLTSFGGHEFLIALFVENAPGGPALVKFRGQLPVIPEPATATLMLLGLMGLASSSRRLARE